MSSSDPFDPKLKRPLIRIREMDIDDLPGVFHLGEELFKAQEVPNMYRTWDAFEVTGLYHSDTEYCLVAEANDQMVGFALGTTISKSHSAWKYGHLIWLGVAPGYQRHGVAEKLFQKFKDLMLRDGVRILMVDTPADNLPSLHFFRKMGFSHPQQHIYLTLNLDAEQQRFKQKGNGSTNHRRLRKTDDAP